MADGISEGIRPARAGEWARIFRDHHRDEAVLAAEGYELERRCGLADGEHGKTAGNERVVGLRSPLQATRQPAGREKRLAPAAYPLAALTPASGRGKRQMPDEVTFVEALDHVRKEQRGEGLLRIAWAQQIERHPHYVGRGRGSATRAQRGSEPSRSHLTRSARQDGPMAALTARLGWQACVTNATPERLSLAEAVLCDRNEDRVERICHRLKSHGHIAPLCVKQDDQSEGLTSLLTLGGRVLTVTEFVRRRSLGQDEASRLGLHPENKRKRTGTPTVERLRHALVGVSLTIIPSAAGEEILRRLTPLSGVQELSCHDWG